LSNRAAARLAHTSTRSLPPNGKTSTLDIAVGPPGSIGARSGLYARRYPSYNTRTAGPWRPSQPASCSEESVQGRGSARRPAQKLLELT